MTQLQLEKKTHAIITYTGVHYPITQLQENRLRKLGINDELWVDGNLVKMKNIADVLTIDKYYETYPKKREEKNIPSNQDLSGLGYVGIIKTDRKKDLEQMMIGLKRYIDSTPENPIGRPDGSKTWYKGGEQPKELYALMETRLKEIA